MSTPCTTSVTNWFAIKKGAEEEFASLTDSLMSEGDISIEQKITEDGKSRYRISCPSDMSFAIATDEDGDPIDYGDIEDFAEELKDLLDESEAFIYICSGYEKMSPIAFGVVATSNEVKYCDFGNMLTNTAANMTGRENASTYEDWMFAF